MNEPVERRGGKRKTSRTLWRPARTTAKFTMLGKPEANKKTKGGLGHLHAAGMENGLQRGGEKKVQLSEGQ